MTGNSISENEKEKVSFNPPLYIQRDQKVIEILKESQHIESVLDLGCAECRLVKKLREIEHLQFICGIDVERNLLENSIRDLEPLPWNAMFPRARPQKLVLLHGSMLEIDELMLGCDAVILTEVVEHLVDEDLLKLPDVVFSSLKPKICIMTTPNFEYNVVFGEMKSMFRHHDHKFEWTRNQFSEWCKTIAQKYLYSVEFTGVGDPPFSHPNVGYCSQIAIFRLLVSCDEIIEVDQNTSALHTRILEVNYPFEDPKSFLMRKIMSKIYYILERETSTLNYSEDPLNKPDGNNNSWLLNDCAHVPLEMLLQNELIQENFEDIPKLRKFLLENNFVLHNNDFVKYDFGEPDRENEDS